MKKTVLLATVAAFAITAPAFADSDLSVKTSATDSAGTTTKTDKSVSVDNKSDGTATTTVKKSASTDPKGLMNKTSGSSKEVVKTDANGNVTSDTKKASGDMETK